MRYSFHWSQEWRNCANYLWYTCTTLQDSCGSRRDTVVCCQVRARPHWHDSDVERSTEQRAVAVRRRDNLSVSWTHICRVSCVRRERQWSTRPRLAPCIQRRICRVHSIHRWRLCTRPHTAFSHHRSKPTFSTNPSHLNTLLPVDCHCLHGYETGPDLSCFWIYFRSFFSKLTSDKGGGTCFCPCLFVCLSVCLSVCLLATLLKNASMDLDEMLRVDRCRDTDELINWARSGS